MKIIIEVEETNWNDSTTYRIQQLAKKFQQEIHINTPEECAFPILTINPTKPEQQIY